MSDTQWPRYQVFQQERPDRPHLNAGSVHAPDPEIALLNARDVFVRRPECASLWVVPADQITSMTAAALAAGEWPAAAEPAAGDPEPYLVFVKRNAKGTHEHAGELQARSSLEAMQQAVENQRAAGSVYWVFPRRCVLASPEQEAASFFGPARDKPYRDQAFYHTDSLMRAVRRTRDQESEES